MIKITELGCPGHLIVASKCRWKRHTQVGKYRISTIGNYYLNGKRETVGAPEDSFFETMIFETANVQEHENEGCGCMAIKDWCELDCLRYATAGEAQAGHEEFIAEYVSKQEA